MNIYERFKRLSFWNKFAAISGAASVIGLILGIIFYLFPTNNDNSAKIARMAAVTNLNNDLEKLKVILPMNQNFSDCMKRRKGSYTEKLEACAQERKLHDEDPQKIIDKHISSLHLNFTDKELEHVDEGLKSIKFLAYEMWNNQMALEAWRANGCSTNVTVLKGDKARRFMQNHKLELGCAITVEGYDSFFERDAKNTNKITAVRQSENSVDKVNYLVVPGNVKDGLHVTIDYFSYRKNNDMFGYLLNDLDTIRPILKRLIEK